MDKKLRKCELCGSQQPIGNSGVMRRHTCIDDKYIHGRAKKYVRHPKGRIVAARTLNG